MKKKIATTQDILSDLIERYQQKTNGVINFELYNQMVHTHHSTAIEGSTLTLLETQILLEKGLTANSKPLEHHLMVIDHQQVQQQVLALAEAKRPLTLPLLQQIGAGVMRQTGGPRNTMLGTFDTSKGDLRLVSAMADSRIFMDAKKVPGALDTLLKELNRSIQNAKTIQQIYDLSFLAHYQLVTIHPFGDGNGRTSRLLMNYVQHYHQLPLSLVYASDRKMYVESLEASRHEDKTDPMMNFMYGQLIRFLHEETQRLTQQQQLKPRRGPELGGLTLLL